MFKQLFLLSLSLWLFACQKDSASEAGLDFKVRFDATQPRLNNIGLPAVMPPGNAAQTPEFREMSIHYIELAPTAFTLLGQGAVVYHAEEINTGGSAAVDFDKAAKAGDGQTIVRVDLSKVPPGTYEWVRASVTYQNYDVRFNIKNLPVAGNLDQQKGTVASFVGFNTYLRTVQPRQRTLVVNANKKQGFWAFETELSSPYNLYDQIFSGDAPEGATTVVNPLFATSPIPPGSCVVTGKFAQPLVITGQEKENIIIELSFSINNSFEWIDSNGNGQIDLYGDGITPNEKIVDMGLRGLMPSWK